MTLPPSLFQRLIDTIFIGYFYSNLDRRRGHNKSKKRRFTVLSLKNKKSNFYFSYLKGREVLREAFLRKLRIQRILPGEGERGSGSKKREFPWTCALFS